MEGRRALEEALAAGAHLETLFFEPETEDTLSGKEPPGAKKLVVSQTVMKSISGATTPPGFLGVCEFVDEPAAVLMSKRPQLAVVLAGVNDPGNAGTILRSAWAAGGDAVFLGPGTVDVYNPKVVRASAGALFHVPISREVELGWLLEELRGMGLIRIGADPRAPAAYDEIDMTAPSAFVFGSEAWGIPEDVARGVDIKASVPMHGAADSLNVAVAASLFLFEAARQRRTV